MIHRLTIALPLARRLLAEYGDFLLIDCTFKLTVYQGRSTIFLSVIDRCGHVHPTHVCDVPGHRESDWLAAFNESWRLVGEQRPTGLKPLSALLMRDSEGAIDSAWDKSIWSQQTSTARCTIHSKWNAQSSKMANGQKFGAQRGSQWYKYVFATCSQSFKDGIATTAALWRDKGDDVGADHLIKLANTSEAPLHKWTPTPCPFIAAGGSESINQLVKRSPGDGTRRKKLTFLQQCKCIIDLAYRSYRLLKHGPLLDSLKMKKRIERHLQRKGKMCEGKYAVLLAGMQQLTFRAVSTLHTPTFLILPHHHAP